MTSYENDKAFEAYWDKLILEDGVLVNKNHMTIINAISVMEKEKAVLLEFPVTQITSNGMYNGNCSYTRVWMPKSAIEQISEDKWWVNAVMMVGNLQWDGKTTNKTT